MGTTARGTVIRELAHEPLGWRATTLPTTVRRYLCRGCGHVWRQDTARGAEPRATLSRRALRWALEGLVVQHLTVARIAQGLAVSWNTADDAVLAEGRRVLIDLTPVHDGTGPSRLPDMVPGRSKAAFKTWPAERLEPWRAGLEVVAMDGFTGSKTATTEELPEATWGIDQRMIIVYREPDRTRGRHLMTAVIESLSRGVPPALTELVTLGRTLKKRATDVLAYQDRPGPSNGPIEAINGHLEHLRGSTLGFRNLANYTARSLLETGDFPPLGTPSAHSSSSRTTTRPSSASTTGRPPGSRCPDGREGEGQPARPPEP